MQAKLPGHRVRSPLLLLSSAIAAACSSLGINVQANADIALAENAPASPTPAQTVGSPATQTLKGEVKTSTIQAAAGIKAIGEGLHKLKRTSQDLIGELQRQNLVVVSEPDVIGPIIMPAVPDPGGTMPLGDYLPPRKKWLDFYLSDMERLIQFIDEERAGTVIPEDKQEEVKEPWAQMQSLIDDVKSRCLKLEPLTAGPNFDRDAIGVEALAIYQDTEELEKLRKQLFHIIKKA